MKKRQFPLIMAGILVLGVIISSCTKDKNLEFSDNLYQNHNEFLKSGFGLDGSLTSIQLLGKNIFFDKISVPANKTACADCHGSSVGFTGPDALINKHGSVYPGANGSFGNRKPPSAAYATFSPVFYYDAATLSFVGGNFWDGRATGERLGSPSAEQALGPFLNPAEHAVPDALTVLKIIEKSEYISLWKKVWGEKLRYSTQEEINLNFDRVGLAIAAYEGSSEVNQFSSKFDYYLKGIIKLSPEEKQGLNLFNKKGKCALCHINIGKKPLFTDFTFDNLGAPINPENPVYDYNPGFIDYGLGGFLLTRPDYISMAPVNMGKHKVPTLRNVDKRPGIGFTKAYMHNGVFKSLKEVVHFYNTRDDGSWPAPEVSANVNKVDLGNLGLTDREENAIVAFMKTLSDGYRK
jgi:cytochrome c peroxidase